MNTNALKTEIVAMVIRHTNPSTNTRQPAPFDEFFSVLVTGKTVEQRQAEEIVEMVENGVKAVKTLVTKVRFNKIVKNI